MWPVIDERVVLDTAAKWQWTPHDAVTVSGKWAAVVIHHDGATVTWEADPDPAALIDEAVGLARRAGAISAVFAVHDLTRPNGMAQALLDRAATVTQELDILALDLSGGLPSLDPPAGIQVSLVDDPRLLPEVYAVDADAFGNPYPTAEFQAADAAQTSDPARTVVRFLGKLGGMPVSSGGLTMDGQVAKLWGGAVIQAYRGRGAYRAVLAARLAEGRARGATLALVKARQGSSSPILRRAGFQAFGVERHFTLALTLPPPPPQGVDHGLMVGLDGVSCPQPRGQLPRVDHEAEATTRRRPRT